MFANTLSEITNHNHLIGSSAINTHLQLSCDCPTVRQRLFLLYIIDPKYDVSKQHKLFLILHWSNGQFRTFAQMSGIDHRINGQCSAGPISGFPASTDFYQLAWSDTDPAPACQAKPSSYREHVAQILRETELGLSDETGGDMNTPAQSLPRCLNNSNWDDDDVIFERRSERMTPDVTSVPAKRGASVQAQVAVTDRAVTGTQGHDQDNTARASAGRPRHQRRDDGRLTCDTSSSAFSGSCLIGN